MLGGAPRCRADGRNPEIRPISDVQVVGVGVDRHCQPPDRAAPNAVDVEDQRLGELPARRRRPGDPDRRVRDVCPRRETPPRLHPLAQCHRRVDVDHLGEAVVGMAPRRHIPPPVVLAVEHPDDAVRATTSDGRRRGRRRTSRPRRRRRGARRGRRGASSVPAVRPRACDADRRSTPRAAPANHRPQASPVRRPKRRPRVRLAGSTRSPHSAPLLTVIDHTQASIRPPPTATTNRRRRHGRRRWRPASPRGGSRDRAPRSRSGRGDRSAASSS